MEELYVVKTYLKETNEISNRYKQINDYLNIDKPKVLK
jgi:hypothetical protein